MFSDPKSKLEVTTFIYMNSYTCLYTAFVCLQYLLHYVFYYLKKVQCDLKLTTTPQRRNNENDTTRVCAVSLNRNDDDILLRHNNNNHCD